MFDIETGPAQQAPLDVDDTVEWYDERFDAWVAELIAADPQARPLPGPAEIVADAERDPVTPALIAQLTSIDATVLDDDGKVALAAAWTRVKNFAAAHEIAAVAAFAGPAPRKDSDLAAFAWTSVGAALHLGDGASSRLVEVARALHGLTHDGQGLPATVAAMRRGDLSYDKAAVLAERTTELTTTQRAAVEARVLPAAAQRTPAQHADAVRRADDRIDPVGADERRRTAREDIELIRHHHGNGMGEVLARLPAEQIDTIWLAADTWARREKTAGDPRTLAQLRGAALLAWATSFLRTGTVITPETLAELDALPAPIDPDTGETADLILHPDTGELTDSPPASSRPAGPPTRHGRPTRVHVIWDLSSLLGLSAHCGELADSGATLAPKAMRELINSGVRVRRLLIDPAAGHLIDLTTARWTLPPADGSPDLPPVVLDLAVPAALTSNDGRLPTAIAAAPDAVRDLLEHPITADELDGRPDTHDPTPALADLVATRDRHPRTPTAGPTAARAGDIDHADRFDAGGRTIRANQLSLTRRWHRAKTHRHWTLTVNADGSATWTDNRTGRTYTTAPHDYRLGP